MDPVFDGSGLGALRADYERVDWATTPLGPVQSWSPALRSTVALTMNTRFAVTLFWGPDYVMIYNEPYSQMIGDKHPGALGGPAADIFPEIWDTIGPMMIGVREQARAMWTRDERLFLRRRGFDEETYFTFSYSPVLAADGTVEGVIDIAAETTQQVIDRRRLVMIAALTAALARTVDVKEVVHAAVATLTGNVDDIAFAVVSGPNLTPLLAAPDQLTAGSRGPEPSQPPPIDPEGSFADLVRVRRFGDRVTATARLDGVATVCRDATLIVGLSPHLEADRAYLEFVQLAAAAITQALDRNATQQVERRTAQLDRQMSETLQRSLLTQPPVDRYLPVAVRYQPAAEHAQVGGDWYDSFDLPDGSFAVVVGDVTGHDRRAAATMAQVRNLLRGIAYSTAGSPSGVLTQLDEAIRGLRVAATGTALLAQLRTEQPPPGGTARRTLTWSSAGHLPPALVHPDGRVELLHTSPDLMLGVEPSRRRSNHAVDLVAGSLVVLYTDGLIERRHRDLDTSLDLLLTELAMAHHDSAEQVCDRLLTRFADDSDDDIVLLAVRI